MSVHYLTVNDFQLAQVSENTTHLVTRLKGITLVMFHARACMYCVKFLPEFKKLPDIVRGINFGLCSVDDNKIVVRMSHKSVTPITGTPKFFLYNNGIPIREYTGPRDNKAILDFLNKVLENANQSFARSRRTRQGISEQQEQADSYSQIQGQSSQYPRGQYSGIAHPQGSPPVPVNSEFQTQPAQYNVNPVTGVKEYQHSYGLPFNSTNEQEYLAIEASYPQTQGRK